MKKIRSGAFPATGTCAVLSSPRRRTLVLSAGACAGLAYLGAALAQTQTKIPRVGFIFGRGAPTATNPDLTGNLLREELRSLGRIEGKTIHIEYRYLGGDYARSAGLVAELLQSKVDILVTTTIEVIRAAKAATKTTPIVMVTTQDPVAYGFVASLARPGGNITGVTRMTAGLSGKRLELLKDLIPGLTRVGYLHVGGTDPEFPIRYDAAAHALKLQLAKLPVDPSNPDLAAAIKGASDARVSALIIQRHGLFLRQLNPLFDLVSKARLPSVCEGAQEGAAGGLLAYSANEGHSFRRAAVYVDKILKAAKPADLPVEQPTKFELVINMKTAKALGIKIPDTIMVRVDRVIE